MAANQHGLRAAAEAIQEVNIVTNAFDAEQGLAGGAAINVSIKSGGNDFHGAVWGYDTNSRFRSRRFFQAANQPINPKDILVQYGYAISGPIILPLSVRVDHQSGVERISSSSSPTSNVPRSGMLLEPPSV